MFICFKCITGIPGIFYAGDASSPIIISKPGVIKFDLWPQDYSLPMTPHVCEVLDDGTVETSRTLIARPPYIDLSCIIPFGRSVPLPALYTVDVPIKRSLIPTGPNLIVWQIFLSPTPCISGNVRLGAERFENNRTSKYTAIESCVART